MQKILIIEDDTDLREGLSFSLASDGYEIMEAGTVKDALQILKSCDCSMVLLDCNLPDGSGFELCTRIKEKFRLPILMLTARDTEMDEVKAFELGMDDFMSKPFSLAVLKARIKKLIRKDKPQMQLLSGGIMIDKNACKVFRNGTEIDCSRIEYQMLVYFVENAGIVLSKEQILAHVWDSRGRYVDDSTIPVNIRRLRAKIEDDPKKPERIITVHGIGYIWKVMES